MPAVVAMQFEISDEAAVVFAEELYTNLVGRKAAIDVAVAEARKALPSWTCRQAEWATPVLFMGDVDVELFSFQIDAAPLPPPRPPTVLARGRDAHAGGAPQAAGRLPLPWRPRRSGRTRPTDGATEQPHAPRRLRDILFKVAARGIGGLVVLMLLVSRSSSAS